MTDDYSVRFGLSLLSSKSHPLKQMNFTFNRLLVEVTPLISFMWQLQTSHLALSPLLTYSSIFLPYSGSHFCLHSCFLHFPPCFSLSIPKRKQKIVQPFTLLKLSVVPLLVFKEPHLEIHPGIYISELVEIHVNPFTFKERAV